MKIDYETLLERLDDLECDVFELLKANNEQFILNQNLIRRLEDAERTLDRMAKEPTNEGSKPKDSGRTFYWTVTTTPYSESLSSMEKGK